LLFQTYSGILPGLNNYNTHSELGKYSPASENQIHQDYSKTGTLPVILRDKQGKSQNMNIKAQFNSITKKYDF
jgi:hypothetical protein